MVYVYDFKEEILHFEINNHVYHYPFYACMLYVATVLDSRVLLLM